MKEYAVIYERGGEGEENWGRRSPTSPDASPQGRLSKKPNATFGRPSTFTLRAWWQKDCQSLSPRRTWNTLSSPHNIPEDAAATYHHAAAVVWRKHV